MATTIISNISSFDFEPDILTDNGRDGITSFQFSVVGSFSSLNSNFSLDQVLVGVPDQPPGNFRVVRRNMSHIAGDTADGLYRLQVSAEGGTGDNSLFVLETSYQYQKEAVSGIVQVPAIDIAITYICEWLSPTATITTNSQSEDVTDVQNRVKALVANLNVQIIRNKPDRIAPIGTVLYPVYGFGINTKAIIITGSSVEKAGGLYRVRASATKGQMQNEFDL
jgi:hypothetical protein